MIEPSIAFTGMTTQWECSRDVKDEEESSLTAHPGLLAALVRNDGNACPFTLGSAQPCKIWSDTVWARSNRLFLVF